MAKSIKLVHTADLHLGTSFSALSELAKRLRQEQMRLFLQIIEYCRKNQTDVLLIAGDLFEQAVPEAGLVDSIINAFSLVPETRIFIAPGNHDPICPDSPYVKANWPDNVSIFREGPQKIFLADLDACIYGAAFQSTAAVRPLMEKENLDLDQEKINILLLHGDLVGSGQSSIYNPVDRNWLKSSGFDYVALGHIHLGHDLPERIEQSNTSFAYSGCPAGRGFDEAGSRGIIAGEISRIERPGLSGRRFRVELDLHRTNIGARRFQVADVDISFCRDQNEIYTAIMDKIADPDTNWQDDLYKVNLIGALEDDLQPATEVLRSRIANEVYFCKINDRTTRKFNLPALAGEHSLMGAFVRQVLGEDKPDWSLISQDKTAVLQTGLQAFEREVPYLEAD